MFSREQHRSIDGWLVDVSCGPQLEEVPEQSPLLAHNGPITLDISRMHFSISEEILVRQKTQLDEALHDSEAKTDKHVSMVESGFGTRWPECGSRDLTIIYPKFRCDVL